MTTEGHGAAEEGPGTAGPETASEPLVRAARAQGVTDARVLAAVRAVPRAAFIPEEIRGDAPYDYALPIGLGQTTSQPSLVAMMVEALDIGPDDVVLEVGTGHGYEAALLGRLARSVLTIERIPALAMVARHNLEAAGVSNVEVVVGDGTLGLPGRAPFDAVVVAAAFVSVPVPLGEQLRQGGRLVMPVGNGGGDLVTLYEKRGDGLAELRVICGARFVPLLGANGFRSGY